MFGSLCTVHLYNFHLCMLCDAHTVHWYNVRTKRKHNESQATVHPGGTLPADTRKRQLLR